MDVQDVLQFLACPKCKGSLLLQNNELICEFCELLYLIEDGIPDLLIENAISIKDKVKTHFKGKQRYWDDNEKAATYLKKVSASANYTNLTVHTFLFYTYKLLVNSKWKAVCRIIKKPRVLYFLDAVCSIKLTQFILTKLLLIKRKGSKFF